MHKLAARIVAHAAGVQAQRSVAQLRSAYAGNADVDRMSLDVL
jgi:hypothetical protein